MHELQGRLFKGSSYGWVVATDDSPGRSTPDIFLINTLTKVKIQLPPRYMFPDVKEYNVDNVDNEYTLHSLEGPYSVDSNRVHLNLLQKVVMSSSPESQDCVLVAIYGSYGSSAWCKCNDKSWKSLYGTRRPVLDVLFYMGRLHALTQREVLVFENIGGPNQKVTKIASPPDDYVACNMYLVESSDGELFMVGQDLDEGEGLNVHQGPNLVTEAFNVYKLDSVNSNFVEVKNIGDEMLFLGLNSSLSISSRKFPGCKGNCIYFTPLDFNSKGSKEIDSDIGMFNLRDGSIESLPGFKCVPRFLWPPPVWVGIWCLVIVS